MRSLTILVFAAAAGLCAQSFEVTSVKLNKSRTGMSSSSGLRNGRLTATNITMRVILQDAWGLKELQVNGPAWIDTDRFDLAGTAPQGVPDTEIKPLLQALLKDRFHLTAHLEKRETQAYNLVVAKEGVKFKLFDPSAIRAQPARMPGAYSMIAGPMTMEQLANHLTGPSGRTVINKTSLEERYFCSVQFSPLGAASDPDQAPDIFGAVQQQLGLKLEPAKAELDALVVDHLERTPTEN